MQSKVPRRDGVVLLSNAKARRCYVWRRHEKWRISIVLYGGVLLGAAVVMLGADWQSKARAKRSDAVVEPGAVWKGTVP